MDTRFTVLGGLFKFLIIISLPMAILFGFLQLSTAQQSIPPSVSGQLVSEPATLILRTPLTTREWTDIGTVLEPLITLPVQTTAGFEKTDFIIDSGAVISSLPRDWADKTGKDLALGKRITFKGFGNTVSFAYQSTMTLQFGADTINLPVVFTEAEGTRSLLGRKGLFDQYSITFDHASKMMEIRK